MMYMLKTESVKRSKYVLLVLAVLFVCIVMYKPANAAAYKPNTEFDTTTNVTTEDVERVQKAFADLCGVDYQPIALLGTQVVAGMNYAYLCESYPVVPNPTISLCVVTIYQDLQGNCKATSIKKIDINKLKTSKLVQKDADDPIYALCGGWDVYPELKQMQTQKKIAGYVTAAMKEFENIEYAAIALLGTKKTDTAVYYKVLCSAKTDTASELHVVVVKVTNKGKVTRIALRQFELGAYM